MRFLDANIFVYAYYKPKRALSQKEQYMKNEAKKIIERVNEAKEEVVTTVIHLAEASNILKHGVSLETLNNMMLGLFMLDNVKILGVNRETYFAATELAGELKLDPNNALIIEVMRLNNIREVYSFDEDLEEIEEITRLPKL